MISVNGKLSLTVHSETEWTVSFILQDEIKRIVRIRQDSEHSFFFVGPDTKYDVFGFRLDLFVYFLKATKQKPKIAHVSWIDNVTLHASTVTLRRVGDECVEYYHEGIRYGAAHLHQTIIGRWVKVDLIDI